MSRINYATNILSRAESLSHLLASEFTLYDVIEAMDYADLLDRRQRSQIGLCIPSGCRARKNDRGVWLYTEPTTTFSWQYFTLTSIIELIDEMVCYGWLDQLSY
jgi:hypothetical protein